MVGFNGGQDTTTLAAAARFAVLLRQEASRQPDMPLRVLGPAPMNILMVNDRYRYKLTIKCRNDRPSGPCWGGAGPLQRGRAARPRRGDCGHEFGR